MRMFLSLVLMLAIAVEARPGGAVVCSAGPNIFPADVPHFRESGALGSLMDGGIVASIAGIGELGPAAALLTGKSYDLELSGGPFRGFLQRLSSGTDKDLSGSFSIPADETNAQLLASDGGGSFGGGTGGLATCPATVAGATHNGGTDKTSIRTMIEIPANQVGDAFLEITVVVNTQTWYYSSYPLTITDPSGPGLSEVTEAPMATDPDTSNAPTTSPEDGVSSHFVFSLWVGLIMFSAPVFFLSL